MNRRPIPAQMHQNKDVVVMIFIIRQDVAENNMRLVHTFDCSESVYIPLSKKQKLRKYIHSKLNDIFWKKYFSKYAYLEGTTLKSSLGLRIKSWIELIGTRIDEYWINLPDWCVDSSYIALYMSGRFIDSDTTMYNNKMGEVLEKQINESYNKIDWQFEPVLEKV